MIEIHHKVTGAGLGDGTQERPYQSGGLYFEFAAPEYEGPKKFVSQHYWVKNWPEPQSGYAAEGYEEVVEMWYGRDGSGATPSFHPSPKAALTKCEISVWIEGSKLTSLKTFPVWIMAFEDEPVPMWSIQCTDGIEKVNADELKWLNENGHLEAGIPFNIFHGTKAELRELLDGSEPGEIPTEPPDIHPDAKVSLQMCYAPVYGFDYDVEGMRRTRVEIGRDIEDMVNLGARAVCLWVTTQHIFYGTMDFGQTNSCVEWYKEFISEAKARGLVVVLKMPFWGIPGWIDPGLGVPERGTERYKRHLEAKRLMASGVARELGEADYVMNGNEPQLTCSIYPHDPGIDGEPGPKWEPEIILEVTKDVLALAPYYGNLELIGPSLSGAVQQVEPKAMAPEEFLGGLVSTLVKYGYKWCGLNAYQLDVFRVPTYTNYGRFYEELAGVFPVWLSECGVARKNVPTDTGLKAHLEGLIEQTMVFSPQLYSHFIYRDFNDVGWGLVRMDGTMDARREVLAGAFNPEAVPPTKQERLLPARVRKSHNIDCGVQLLHRGWEPIHVEVLFFRGVARWDGDELVDTEKEGELVGGVDLELGPSNPVAFNVGADLKLDGVDAVVVRSDDDLGALVVWTTDATAEHSYSGFPVMS